MHISIQLNKFTLALKTHRIWFEFKNDYVKRFKKGISFRIKRDGVSLVEWKRGFKVIKTTKIDRT